ncbi:hypothetical protein V8F33_010448 [Rhypophila sp. PSN 637]
MADLHAWNPALGSDCSGLYLYYWICVGIQPQTSLTVHWPTNATLELPPYVTWTGPPVPTTFEPFTPSPTQGALPTDCLAWYKARPDDNCQAILDEYDDITEAQFFAWHPFLNDDCNALWEGNYYCVGAGASPPPAPNTTATGSSYVPPSSIVTVLPTFVSGCHQVHVIKANDTCQVIIDQYDITTLANLLLWNPDLPSSFCDTDPLPRRQVCVHVPGSSPASSSATSGGGSSSAPPISSSSPPSSSITTTSTSTGTGGGPIITPSPAQANMTPSCRRFYLVQSGDGCWAIANSAGIDLTTEFYVWNPDVAGRTTTAPVSGWTTTCVSALAGR